MIVTGPLAAWTGGRTIVLVAVIVHVLGAAKHLLFERRKLAGHMILN